MPIICIHPIIDFIKTLQTSLIKIKKNVFVFQHVCLDTMGLIVQKDVLILHTERDAKVSVTVTRTCVMCLQDVNQTQQVSV